MSRPALHAAAGAQQVGANERVARTAPAAREGRARGGGGRDGLVVRHAAVHLELERALAREACADLGSRIWGQKIGSEGSRLAESEQGVRF